MMETLVTDLLVIGGGINGTGIAADAAGRDLSVILCEKGDLASATSSTSSKLIHGGLRYLEQYNFKLVHEALKERDILLKVAPHLIHPLKFILPHDQHLRPAWLIRLGLFLYDHLAHNTLPKSKKINFIHKNNPLKQNFKTGFSYFDAQTDDSRLVIVNAMAAHEKGAKIFTRTNFISAARKDNMWEVELDNKKIQAKAIVNATGPWVTDVLKKNLQSFNS